MEFNSIILYFLLIHWLGDFVLQTSHMAIRKSTSNYYLGMHVTVYTVTTILGWFLLFLIYGIHATWVQYFCAGLAIFSMHFLTDYITSRITGKYYKQQKNHEFFVTIGFDQWLHYLQIFIVYNYIILK
tara:strand:- start:5214 stop:5597 length:384 start_codon:yes stop_codon:yes gene_type:complete